jgi:hypothetical protein
MKVQISITEVSVYPLTSKVTGNVQNRVRIAGVDAKGNEVIANVSQRQFANNNEGNPKDYQGGTATVQFYEKGDEMVGGQICSQSGKIVVNLSCVKSMETRVIEQMSNQMAQLMLTKMGLGSNLITIQGTPVSQAPVKEEVEEESDLVPEDFQEKM